MNTSVKTPQTASEEPYNGQPTNRQRRVSANKKSRFASVILVAVLVFTGIHGNSCSSITPKVDCSQSNTTQYLAFQLFTSRTLEPVGDYQPLRPLISQGQMEDFFSTVRSKVGISELKCRKIAVILGPIALDFSDAEISNFISQAFAVAEKYDIAVGFHIDDGMFWAKRTDLWQNPENVEWIDWNKTPNTSRHVDWITTRLAPEMCFNAPQVKAAMKSMMSGIAAAIKSNYDRVTTKNKEYLYAGTIVGWETSIDPDRDTQRSSGYHALFNKGFRQNNLPGNIDQERAILVQEYIDWIAAPFSQAGLPIHKTYSHVGFLSKKVYDSLSAISPAFAKKSYNEVNYFSPPEIAIGTNYTPGFSTYPQNGLFDQIYALVKNVSWVSSEGTNISLTVTPPASPGYGMESYLARHFNYGCTLLNIFAFQLRGDPFTEVLNDASEGAEAIAAYKKFLSGARLTE